eukprot:m.107591 g.107591  ORF g.107591 m.107591 type:complete len:1386 (+) comp15193_c0_seq1:108-4265(+)
MNTALVAVFAILAATASALPANEQEGMDIVAPSSVPDLLKLHEPVRENRRYSEHLIVHGAEGQKTELKYGAQLAEDAIVLADFMGKHFDHSFRITTITCEDNIINLQVTDVNAALKVLRPDHIMIGGPEITCGQSHEHGFAALIEGDASLLGAVLSFKVEFVSVLEAFDEIELSFNHALGDTEDTTTGNKDLSEQQGGARVRRMTQSGCTCATPCVLTPSITNSRTACETYGECGEEDCGLLSLFSCTYWDYCTLERAQNFDVFSWNTQTDSSATVSSILLATQGPVNVYCDNCFAFIRVGLNFEFRMSGNRVDLLQIQATGTAKASIGIRAIASGQFEWTSGDITLVHPRRGPTLVIPLGPAALPLSTEFSVFGRVGFFAEAQVQATTGATFERSVGFGFRYTRERGTEWLQSIGGSGFSYTQPSFSVEVSATAKTWIMPQLRVFIAEWLPLSATFRLAPYAGVTGSLASCGVLFDVFTGVDLAIDTQPVQISFIGVLSFTLIDARSVDFNIVQKTTIYSRCVSFSRRRDLSFIHIAPSVMQPCDFECPSDSTCMNDNGIAACYCNPGFQAVHLTRVADYCKLTESEEACVGVDCSHLPNSECRFGMCYCREGFMISGTSATDATCVRDVANFGDDSCSTDNVECPTNSQCVDGDCVCDDGFYLEEVEDNLFICRPTDPCRNIVCGENAYCVAGNCHCAVGYRRTADGFSCAPHYPECGSLNNNVMDTDSCFADASCVVDPNFEDRKHCMCEDDTKIVYRSDGSVTCQENDRCGGFFCLPGYVCQVQPSTRIPACVPVNDPCAVDNGGCGVNAHCLVSDDGSGWQCECNEGYAGDPLRGCEMIDACSVHANGGCSIHATCDSSSGVRNCTCREGYTGDGITCVFSACQEDNGGCDANAVCMRGPEYGSIECQCRTGFYGNGYNCTAYDPCLINNGGCDVELGVCLIDNGQPTCHCTPGYVLAADNRTCIGGESCDPAEHGLYCSADASCVRKNGIPTCECHPGYRNVVVSGLNAGARCQRIDPCSENADDLCPKDNQVCVDDAPGRFHCACRFGYEMNAMQECEPINPCDFQHVSRCDVDAICTYLGPGRSRCDCMTNYTGNGYQCDPMNPCLEDGELCSGEGEECAMLGAGEATCKCKAGYVRNQDGVCEARNLCNVMRGGCPSNSICRMKGVNDFDCVCNAGFFPEMSERYSTGVRALRACRLAAVDLLTKRRALTMDEADEIVRTSLEAYAATRNFSIAATIERSTAQLGSLYRLTIYVDRIQRRDRTRNVSVNATLVALAINATMNDKASPLHAASAMPPLVGAFVTVSSPYAATNLASLTFQSTKADDGGLTGGQVAGIVIGVLAAVALLVGGLVLVRKRSVDPKTVFPAEEMRSSSRV